MFLKDKMNKNVCTDPDKELFEHKVLPALYIFVFIVGLVANVWGLKSLLQNWKKPKNINVFILNLGLADILYLLTLPFLVVYYFNENTWIFGDELCKVTRFCFHLNLYCSIGFLTCISVYRYLAIVHPMKVMGRLTVTHSVIISVLVWILVGVLSLPDMFYPKSSENKTQCYDTTSKEYVKDYLNYSLGWTLAGFFVPLLIILGSYGHMICVLCHKNTIHKVRKKKSLRMLFILILLFSVCYTPHHVFKNFNLYSRVLRSQNICKDWNSWVFNAHQIGRGLVSLNSALNPLVYLHAKEDISAQFRQLLQRVYVMFHQIFKSKLFAEPVAQTDEDDV